MDLLSRPNSDSIQFPSQEDTVKTPPPFTLHRLNSLSHALPASLASGWLHFQKLEAVHSRSDQGKVLVLLLQCSWFLPRTSADLYCHALLDPSLFLCLLFRGREGTLPFPAPPRAAPTSGGGKKSFMQLSTSISCLIPKCEDV